MLHMVFDVIIIKHEKFTCIARLKLHFLYQSMRQLLSINLSLKEENFHRAPATEFFRVELWRKMTGMCLPEKIL